MTDLLLALLSDTSLRSVVVAALVAVVLFSVRVRASALRHVAWAAVLAAMLLMPILARVVPLSYSLPERSTVLTGVFDSVGQAIPDLVSEQSDVVTSTMIPLTSAATVPPPMPARKTAPPPEGARRSIDILVPLYFAGAVVFFARLLYGLRVISRIRRQSRPICDLPDRPELLDVFESSLVGTPMTVGLASPRIVLPFDWRAWSTDKLEAVLTHERAHVRRHDALVALLAHVNRCIFWFHPLAWWLERTLTATAEQACDEEVVRTLGAPRRYAEVLLDMAQSVRRAGGRVAWQGLGVEGNGHLGVRIDRILAGSVTRASRGQMLAVTASCIAVILAVVACRQESTPAPLQENPALTAELATQQARMELARSARVTSPDQVANLEAILARNPEDAAAREKLLVFYHWTGKNTQDWNENVAARRRHALWLTEHHPDSDLLHMARLSKQADPAGYSEVRKLWLGHTAKPDVSSKVLSHAAFFFEASEKPMAEQFLLRAKAIDPEGPQPHIKDGTYYRPWSGRLGELYAQVIVGSTGPTTLNVVRETNPKDADSPYARDIRKKLDESTDAVLLGTAGRYLAVNASNVTNVPERVTLARKYLQRAKELDPQSQSMVRQTLDFIDATEQRGQRPFARSSFEGVARESRTEVVERLPADERLPQLANLADDEYGYAGALEYVAHRPDKRDEYSHVAADLPKYPGTVKEARERSKRYAQQALELAATRPRHPSYGDVIHRANLTLALNALWDGDRKTSARYLLAAADAPEPATPRERRFPGMLEGRLTVALLKYGERDSVAEYLERSSKGREANERDRMLKEAADIRAGRMPDRYQRLLASSDLN